MRREYSQSNLIYILSMVHYSNFPLMLAKSLSGPRITGRSKLWSAPWLSWLERVTVMQWHHKVESSSLSGAVSFFSPQGWYGCDC